VAVAALTVSSTAWTVVTKLLIQRHTSPAVIATQADICIDLYCLQDHPSSHLTNKGTWSTNTAISTQIYDVGHRPTWLDWVSVTGVFPFVQVILISARHKWRPGITFGETRPTDPEVQLAWRISSNTRQTICDVRRETRLDNQPYFIKAGENRPGLEVLSSEHPEPTLRCVTLRCRCGCRLTFRTALTV